MPSLSMSSESDERERLRDEGREDAADGAAEDLSVSPFSYGKTSEVGSSPREPSESMARDLIAAIKLSSVT